MDAQAAAPLNASLTMTGTYGLEVLSSGPAGAVLVGRLDDLQVDATTPIDAPAHPFLVEVGTDCQLTRFARWNDAPMLAARNQQALLWESQWRLPSGTEAFQGEDGLGHFSATLSTFENAMDGEGEILRTIDAYSTLWRSDERDARASGRMVVTLGEGPWFESLVSSQHLGSRDASVDSRLELTRRDARGVSFTSDERDPSRYTWENLLPLRFQRPVRQVTEADLRRREAVRNLSLEQALGAMTTRATTPGVGLQDVWPDLSAWFEVHPDQIAPAVDQLRTGVLKNPQARMSLYVALGNARVPEAKTALLEIKRSPYAPPIERTRAIFSLIDRDDVDASFARELATDAEALASASTRGERFMPAESLLALSTMAGRRGEPELRSIAGASIRTALSTGRDPSVRVALKALANTGDLSLIPEARRFTIHPDAKMREAAASIFRRMPPRETDALAIEWLRRESHPFVKGNLYRVIRSQHFDAQDPASRELVQQALIDLDTTKSKITRKHIIKLVASSSVAREPEVRAFGTGLLGVPAHASWSGRV